MMMKDLNKLTSCLVLCATLAFASCSSSDGDSKTKVKYEIHTETNMTTSIMYRDASGDMVQGLEDIILDWDKTVNVDTPFNAHIDVVFMNPTSASEEYMISIYEDGEMVDHQMGMISPNSTTTESADFDIE